MTKKCDDTGKPIAHKKPVRRLAQRAMKDKAKERKALAALERARERGVVV